MRFFPTNLDGAYLIEIEPINDDRGFFARSFCQAEFREEGLPECFPQSNISFNHVKGTLRGLHFQKSPFEEAKLVRCTRGAIFDVLVDLRTESPTFKEVFSIELSASNHRMVFIPAGFAHGFQTLMDDTEVMYQMDRMYEPDQAAGVRYDDPALSIAWPKPVTVISQADLALPHLDATLL